MKLLRVANIKRGCVCHGPGVRTTVFLPGCPLNCPWCCNPEMRDISNKEWQEYAPDKLAARLLQDKSLFKRSGGGITFSGGEPLLSAKELKPLLEILAKDNVSIFFETTLMVKEELIKDIAGYTDGLIVDLKLQPEMEGYDNSLVIRNIRQFRELIKYYRLVVTDSIIDKSEEVVGFLQSNQISSIELLKCHNLAQKKFLDLGITAKNYSPDSTSFGKFCENIKNMGICVNRLVV